MAETISMPKLGFDMAEGKLIRWVKKVGETINKGDVLAEIETDKATVEVESSAGGVVRELLVDEGAVVPVNSPIAIVGTADEKIEKAAGNATTVKAAGPEPTDSAHPDLIPVAAPTIESTPPTEPAAGSQPGKASPLARRIARESKLDLGGVKGTGPGGRIVRRDIEAALAAGGGAAVVVPVTVAAIPGVPGVDETVGLTRLRQAIARRMAESKTSIPHFYVTHEYKMDALLELRRQFNTIVPENEKLSVNDLIVKSVALALRQFPNLNASFNGTSIVRHGSINIGVAVSVEGGLLTIVCREADKKPLRQVSAEVKTMAARVREGKVRTEEIEGSTFSISNLGMYDVENFLAIINPPEAAILAVGSARELAVVEGGTVKVGWRMKATLSVDHRVSDGAEGARFMQALAVFLEEPLRLLV